MLFESHTKLFYLHTVPKKLASLKLQKLGNIRCTDINNFFRVSIGTRNSFYQRIILDSNEQDKKMIAEYISECRKMYEVKSMFYLSKVNLAMMQQVFDTGTKLSVSAFTFMTVTFLGLFLIGTNLRKLSS